jgi:hypothetical protein
MAIVMKQYLGVREDANGTKQIPVNSNTTCWDKRVKNSNTKRKTQMIGHRH